MYSPSDENRLVIPRWREYKKTIKSGELTDLNPTDRRGEFESDLEKARNSWSLSKSSFNSIELINSALISGKYELIEEPLEIIKSISGPLLNPLKKLAQDRLTFGKNGANIEIVSGRDKIFRERLFQKISVLKASLINYGHNPIAWLQLGRWYVVLGQIEKAYRCVSIALSQSPNNRFIIRSASRFFMHIEDYDQAHHVVIRSKRLKLDPWLLATEISSKALMDKSSNYLKHARAIINSQNYSAYNLTEIRSALATNELMNGKTKNARKLFYDSLSDPNDNSLAQAEWASKYIPGFDVNPEKVRIPNNSEALSYHFFGERKFKKSQEHAIDWFFDQPFSRAPVQQVSFIASSFTKDFNEAIEICRLGLRANPSDPSIVNNLSYALAMSGNTKAAEIEHKRIDLNDLKSSEKVYYFATKGLIEFRGNRPESGSKYYMDAIEVAKKNKLKNLEYLAKGHMIREQSRNQPKSSEAIEKLNNLMKELSEIDTDNSDVTLIRQVIDDVIKDQNRLF